MSDEQTAVTDLGNAPGERSERELALRNTPKGELEYSAVFTIDEIASELARRAATPVTHR